MNVRFFWGEELKPPDLFTPQQNKSKHTVRLVCLSPSFVSFKLALFAHAEIYLCVHLGSSKKQAFVPLDLKTQRGSDFLFLFTDEAETLCVP